jgi:heme oxygenase
MTITAEKDIATAKDLFLQKLRGQTAYWHQQLEQTRISKVILEDSVTINDYRQYLVKMYGFVQPFEDLVLPQLATFLPDIDSRRKVRSIEKDLVAIGMDEQEIKQLPRFSFDTNWSEAEALGAMYVMEGSSLGGAVIYKHIAKILGLSNGQGASYFYGYGPTTGSNWKAFINTLTQYAMEQNAGQQITDSAENTFKNIHGWFGRQ